MFFSIIIYVTTRHKDTWIADMLIHIMYPKQQQQQQQKQEEKHKNEVYVLFMVKKHT